MNVSSTSLINLVNTELRTVNDNRVVAHIKKLMVTPKVIMRQWDYGAIDTKYPCWSILDHLKSDTGIVYSQHGFGPTHPWGLVKLSGSENDKSIGMDCGWFPSFIESYFESFASSDLAIWRVFKGEKPITEESSWDSTWERVYEMRNSDSECHYHCDHSIGYQKSDI